MEQAAQGSGAPEEDFRTAWEQWTANLDVREPVRGDVRQGVVLA